jgi:hypothetical protein
VRPRLPRPYGKKLMFFWLMIVDRGRPLSTAFIPTIVPHGRS